MEWSLKGRETEDECKYRDVAMKTKEERKEKDESKDERKKERRKLRMKNHNENRERRNRKKVLSGKWKESVKH